MIGMAMPECGPDYLYAFGRQVRRMSRRGAALAWVKIGRSKEPSGRMTSLACSFPGEDLWVIDQLPRMSGWEKRVHLALDPWAIGGEWFDHVILLAIMRWGFPAVVAWALGDEARRRTELGTFLSYAAYDVEEDLMARFLSGDLK